MNVTDIYIQTYEQSVRHINEWQKRNPGKKYPAGRMQEARRSRTHTYHPSCAPYALLGFAMGMAL